MTPTAQTAGCNAKHVFSSQVRQPWAAYQGPLFLMEAPLFTPSSHGPAATAAARSGFSYTEAGLETSTLGLD
jgi:hypothetical protein